MTKTIKSQSSDKHYFLTIEQGHATDCTCPDRNYRHHTCKHMRGFDADVERAAEFLAMMARFDVRSRAVREQEYTNYLNWQLSMGL